MIWMWEEVWGGLRLNHDVTTSDRSAHTPKFQKIDPRLGGGSIGLMVVPYTHSQLIKVQNHFIYIWYGFVKHSKWGLRLNHDVTTPDRSAPTRKFLKIDSSRLRGGISICPSTAYQGAKTLAYIWYKCGSSLRGFGGPHNRQNCKNTHQKPNLASKMPTSGAILA